MRFQIDPQKTLGPVKPLHAVGAGPLSGGAKLPRSVAAEYREIGVPYSRLHDVEGPYGGMHYIDVHCIFPDFNADPNDPAAYRFSHSDKYIAGIYEAGGKVFYRLGESIDHYEQKLYIAPPADYRKWAQICEHIILHYNEGWANGFSYGIEYWEIWNEPDNKGCQWLGTPREFYEFYAVAAIYLKKRFPALKIGGYAASGFYASNRENPSDWFRSLIPYAEGFFNYITSYPERVPLDFFSWHCYAQEPEEIALHAAYARALLDRYGYAESESVLDEYNTFESLKICPSTLPHYAAQIAAGLITAQSAPLDMMMYYDIRFTFMNGLFQLGSDFRSVRRMQAYYAMRGFGALYRLGTRCAAAVEEAPEKTYILAAADENAVGVLFTAAGSAGDAVIRVPARFTACTVRESRYDAFDQVPPFSFENGELKFRAEKEAIYEIRFSD